MSVPISPERAFVAAVRQVLLADPSVGLALGSPPRIVDEPVSDVPFPYVSFGPIESRARDAAGAPALEHQLSVNLWSRYPGRAEALDAIATLRAALHDRALPVSGRRVVFCMCDTTSIARLGDGHTILATLRLRALTEAT